MGRPGKKGLDYFGLDVDFDQDEKIKIVVDEFGPPAGWVIVTLLARIYSDGFYITWGERARRIHASRAGVSLDFLDKVIAAFIRWEFFDETVFNAHCVLTSVAIQTRYLRMKEKSAGYPVEETYLLIEFPGRFRGRNSPDTPAKGEDSPGKQGQNSVSGVETPSNPIQNVVSSEKTPQSKVKESKVNKRREEEEGEGARPAEVSPSDRNSEIITLALWDSEPVVAMTRRDFRRLVKRLGRHELRYWLNQLKTAARKNLRDWKRKYSDHAAVIYSWRNMRLEEGKTWDAATRCYVKPQRENWRFNGSAPVEARMQTSLDMVEKFRSEEAL